MTRFMDWIKRRNEAQWRALHRQGQKCPACTPRVVMMNRGASVVGRTRDVYMHCQYDIPERANKARQRGYISTVEVVVIIAIAIIVASFVVLTPKSCHARWAGSEFKTSFGWVKGCQISRDGGKTWIPEDRYREIAD